MKKLLMAVAAFGMLLTSCAKDDVVAPVEDKEALVSFCVNSPAVATRYGEGEKATTLYWAVYDNVNGRLTELQGSKEIKLSTTVDLKLIQGREYEVLFWAADAQAPYTVDWDAKTMTVSDVLTANKEEYDAFFKYEDLGRVNGAISRTIELRRPFAQLNIGTGDTTEAEMAKFAVAQTEVTVEKIYNTLNFVDGSVSGEVSTTFALANKAEGTISANGKSYDHIAMNYLLVGDKKLVNVTLNINDEVERKYTSVPVQRNYRTNIVGNIITAPAEFNVVILPGFTDDNYEEWDGESLNEPFYDEPTKTYHVSNPGALAYLAALVNGTLDTDDVTTRAAVAADNLSGKTIVLECDIDLNGVEWTPIGTSSNPFYGKFDGQGNTIRNLVITGNKSNVGIFGDTRNGEIKNLVVENAKVSGRLNVGVVAGNPYTSKYSNITVKGHVEVNGMSYVGGVGGKNAYANWNNIKVDVDETSYVNANSVENGTAYRTYVGGVIGFMGEGGHTVSNVTSNINVKGSTCDVGGIVGIAHYGNKFVNVSCNADVEIYAAGEEADVQEIGGIAGVWMNSSANEPVTFTNCTFEGELKANDGYVINTKKFGNLVCAAYNADGPGKLIIDGVEYMQTEEGSTINGATAVDGTAEGQETLKEKAAEGGDVIFVDDVTTTDTGSNGYGSNGISVNGGTLDGNGHTLEVEGANSTWDSAIAISNGTIKNITVAKGFRGIFVKTGDASKKIILENVIIDGPTYTISCDQASGQGLAAYNCTLNGWTSYAATIGSVYFEGCSFGEGAGYAYCRPYAPTTFKNCEFEAGFRIDARAACVFENCTLDGEALTASNIATLVVSNLQNAIIGGEKIVASGITVDDKGNYSVSNGASFDDVNDVLENGGNIVLTEDVEGEAATTAPYGNKCSIKQDGGVIDGGGNKLDMEGSGDYYGIMTSGGTVKNITIEEGCRAIMIMHPTEDVILDNVNIGGDGVLYPINTGEAGSEGVNLIVTNSTLAGWTSYGEIESASFTNVKFEQGTYYNDVSGRVLKPYVNTTITDCSFIAHMNLDLSKLASGHKIVFKNCKVDGQELTIDKFTIPSTDADYDTKLFTIDLPGWATSIADCVVFE
ncbi:MAG: hypothetical protein J6L75_07150 [Alistipes sp.]|nr:hypothetical protein [Alistipes sp.]